MDTKRGFTLIEIIAVLILMAVFVVAGVQLLSNVMLGYVTAERTYENTQKAQVALDRIVFELSHMGNGSNITASTGTSITYTATFGGTAETHTVHRDGTRILYLQDDIDYPLMDNVDAVNGLNFLYHDSYDAAGTTSATANTKLVTVSITFDVGQNQSKTLTTRVAINAL